MPVAIDARAADRRRQVVSLSGDSGFAHTIDLLHFARATRYPGEGDDPQQQGARLRRFGAQRLCPSRRRNRPEKRRLRRYGVIRTRVCGLHGGERSRSPGKSGLRPFRTGAGRRHPKPSRAVHASQMTLKDAELLRLRVAKAVLKGLGDEVIDLAPANPVAGFFR